MPSRDCPICESRTAVKLVKDFGLMGLSNNLVSQEFNNTVVRKYPLRLLFCENCVLFFNEVAIPQSDIFNSEYPYFSGTSLPWIHHCEDFISLYEDRVRDTPVLEIACNDGTLVKRFIGIADAVLGVEPCDGPAQKAESEGVHVYQEFFTERTAEKVITELGRAPQLVIANNVLAHIPDPTDFLRGLARLYKEGSIVSVEVPSAQDLLVSGSYDCVYHEHCFYHSVTSLVKFFSKFGICSSEIQHLAIHGGSIRLVADPSKAKSPSSILSEEIYKESKMPWHFEESINKYFYRKLSLLELLVRFSSQGLIVAGVGAAAKGFALLEYSGITSELMQVVFDDTPDKIGKKSESLEIPIKAIAHIKAESPDVCVILAWNFKEALLQRLRDEGFGGSVYCQHPTEPKFEKVL